MSPALKRDFAASHSIPDKSLLARYDGASPRYTSYPTADQYTESYGPNEHLHALGSRVLGGLLRPLSLYVHIPFCRSICYYCACNKVITHDASRSARYLQALYTEARLVRQALASATPVIQLHLGGGTPTFLRDAELQQLLDTLHGEFAFAPNAELSIEIDPRTVDAYRLTALRTMGFNRISFGVQDFDPDVQTAVHRIQPQQAVFALMQRAREIGFGSINVDMIYGLPRQTPVSFARTLDSLVALAPDRIAMYAYAHLPERFRPQRRIDATQLPDAHARVDMLHAAITRLTGAGWDYIGMDHFALPDDDLAVARRQGRLHRNFQGYTTHPQCDLIALGASSISRVGTHYAQNVRTLNAYYDCVENGRLGVFRGHTMNADDLLRHAVIMAIMCQGAVEYADIDDVHLINFTQYFRTELERLQSLADDGLVEISAAGLRVTDAGWFVVRFIAMIFDRYVNAGRARTHYAKVL